MPKPLEVIPVAALRRRKIPTAPSGFRGARTEFISNHLDPVLPAVEVVESFHRALVAYVKRPDALFLVRKVSRMERGTVVSTLDGTDFKPTDNAPAWWWHAVLFNAVSVEPEQLPAFIGATPCEWKEVLATPTVNGAGWHVAHVLNARFGDTKWQSWSRSSVVWRFIRNIHPCNVFYVPKPEWRRVGADAELIESVAAHYRRRYAAIWAEFVHLSGALMGLGETAPDGPLVIPSTIPAPAARNPPRAARLRPADAITSADAWRAILRVDHAPPVGKLLARHPDAIAFTQRLLSGLTVERLIAIADALHNKCRISELGAAAPGDPQRQAELAWAALFLGARKTYGRPSGWTGCAKLLAVGHVEGLAAVAALDIGAVAGVCARIVSGPYRRANASGLR